MRKFFSQYTEYQGEVPAEVNNAVQCYMCGDAFAGNTIKHHDHCWVTGASFGMSCMRCNTHRRRDKQIPLFFHNAQGYDTHLVMDAMKHVAQSTQ